VAGAIGERPVDDEGERLRSPRDADAAHAHDPAAGLGRREDEALLDVARVVRERAVGRDRRKAGRRVERLEPGRPGRVDDLELQLVHARHRRVEGRGVIAPHQRRPERRSGGHVVRVADETSGRHPFAPVVDAELERASREGQRLVELDAAEAGLEVGTRGVRAHGNRGVDEDRLEKGRRGGHRGACVPGAARVVAGGEVLADEGREPPGRRRRHRRAVERAGPAIVRSDDGVGCRGHGGFPLGQHRGAEAAILDGARAGEIRHSRRVAPVPDGSDDEHALRGGGRSDREGRRAVVPRIPRGDRDQEVRVIPHREVGVP